METPRQSAQAAWPTRFGEVSWDRFCDSVSATPAGWPGCATCPGWPVAVTEDVLTLPTARAVTAGRSRVIRREDTVAPMSVFSWRRDQVREAIEKLMRREGHHTLRVRRRRLLVPPWPDPLPAFVPRKCGADVLGLSCGPARGVRTGLAGSVGCGRGCHVANWFPFWGVCGTVPV